MLLLGRNLGKRGIWMTEQNTLDKDEKNKMYQALLFVGVIFVAFNLRPAITSVGPLIGTIRDDIGLSNWSVALLTSLPLVAFAMMSPIAPKLANRLSNEATLALGLFILIIGISLRSITIIAFLFLGTLFVGLGIAICNVLLPGVIKEKFPTKVAIMTSIYTTSMGILATTASGVSVPLSEGLHLGWQLTLFIWIFPAIVGLIIWLVVYKKKHWKKRKWDMEVTTCLEGSSVYGFSIAYFLCDHFMAT